MVALAGDELWSVTGHWKRFAHAIRADVVAFDQGGPRVRQAIACGVAVAFAIWLAIVLNLDYPMWSGISAFTCLQSSAAASALKGLLRILGTITGALVAAFLIHFVAQDHFVLLLALFVGVSFSLYRSYLSRWMYAWLLGGITFGLVLMMTLADASAGLHAGAYRAAEIIVGAASAWLSGALLLPAAIDPERDKAIMAKPKPGSKRRAALTAINGGIGIVTVIVLYDLFDFPGFSSSFVSIIRIADLDPQVGRHRGFLRLIGCVVGGGVGLLVVGFAMDWLPSLLFWVFAWSVVFAYFGSGSEASGYAGFQAAIAFYLTCVPDMAPAVTLDPAIDRLAGIVMAMAVCWGIDVLLGSPGDEARSPGSQRP